MSFCDFVVKYDPSKDTQEDITKRILASLILLRLKHKKPAITFISGSSGEGKSISALMLQLVLLEMQGLNLKDYINDINVYTPLEYPRKLDALLFDKRLKKVNLICMHEAREIIKAKNWQSFLTQSVSDVNAMSRSVKRLGIFIISQFIRDITADVRYTLDYYIKAVRPRGKSARLYISKMWKDDRDLEKPKLKKRKIMGYLMSPNGKYQRYIPQYLELGMPPKEIVDTFEKSDYDAKAGIIKKKIQKLLNEMKEEIGEQNTKVNAMVDWYTNNTDNIALIGKKVGKQGFKTNKEFREMHDMTDIELKQFEKRIDVVLKEKGMYGRTEPIIEPNDDIDTEE